MNFKNMTYREITRMISTVNTTTTMDEAARQLDELIESFKILKNMLEGSKALQMQKDKLKRRRGLKVITKRNKRRD
jgi:regulator of replication initiation timing